MLPLLIRFARAVDWTTRQLGKLASWAVLLAALISAGNAFIRYGLDMSSNAWLEIQWYLFAAIFLLGAGYTMLRQEHVRIDVILGRFSKRTQIKVDIFGIVCFLFPLVITVIAMVTPLVIKAFETHEMSSNAGGLVRWPVFALVPAGFALLGLQGVSELIKRFAFLQGKAPNPLLHGAHESNEAHDAANAHPHHDDAGEVQK